MTETKIQNKIIIFDGICILCNTIAAFLKKRLNENEYNFVASQSDEGLELISKYNLGRIPYDSIVLIFNKNIYTKSDAVFQIINDLSFGWQLFKVFKIFPKFLRDSIYDLIAVYRHKVFGKVK